MKIEPAKNFTVPKNNSSKLSLSDSESEVKGDDGANAEGSGDFASVLENLSTKKQSADQTDVARPREKEVDSKRHQSDKADQKSLAQDKPDNESGNREEAAGAAAAHSISGDIAAPDTELSIPPARAIMHIADLERIVSSFRAQTLDGNSQVVITLKNSVCSGLQIKLTTDDKQRVTAEFIAANEKVKAQIDARSGELADLLRQRGLKLTSLQSSVGSETSGGNDNRQNSRDSHTQAVLTKDRASAINSEIDQIAEASETASSYRV